MSTGGRRRACLRFANAVFAVAAGTSPRLTSYFAIVVPEHADSAEIVQAVAAWPHVELAYVEGGPVPPPVNSADDTLSGNQKYLSAAPVGIDAHFAWTQTDGSGIGLVNLEQGWTLDHEDLPAPISVIGPNQQYPGWAGPSRDEMLVARAPQDCRGFRVARRAGVLITPLGIGFLGGWTYYGWFDSDRRERSGKDAIAAVVARSFKH